MTICSERAEYEWLTGNEARALLEEIAADLSPLHTLVARLRSRLTSNQTHLLMEQVELRRRATAKFSQAQRMFFTRQGLEQATDEWVAGYKASRFAELRNVGQGSRRTLPIVDLCCGIDGDLMALAGLGSVVGVDNDPVATHFAAINSGASVRVIDIAEFAIEEAAAWHIDPDRRPGGRRTTSLEWSQPNLATIELLLQRAPHAAIKLAPATDVPLRWPERCELEWISRDRECRQLVAWHGNLAIASGQHRATVVPTASGIPPRTLTGRPKQPVTIVETPDRYVFDLDAAVLAAKLKGAVAAEHGLSALGAGPTYLTGPQAIVDPAMACFAVAEVLPFQTNKVASSLRGRNIGQLEIKKRGVDVDPEKLRRDLRLRGDHAATLLITQVAGRATAILASRFSA